MNKTLFVMIPAAAFGALVALASAPQGAIASGADSGVRVVDLDAVIQKSGKAQTVMAGFRSFQDKKRGELKQKEQEVASLQKTLDRNSPPEKLNDYGRKVQEIQVMAQKAELESQQEFMKTREKLLSALRPTFEKYAKEKGVGILLDKTTGGVVYSASALDVTADLKALAP
ncbi:MAG: hypothetical protein RJA70_4405 [Pseudomonadota bacterium]|jgi:Skp family chaperone for outer membrane proteins